jgi:hypothetical protein
MNHGMIGLYIFVTFVLASLVTVVILGTFGWLSYKSKMENTRDDVNSIRNEVDRLRDAAVTLDDHLSTSGATLKVASDVDMGTRNLQSVGKLDGVGSARFENEAGDNVFTMQAKDEDAFLTAKGVIKPGMDDVDGLEVHSAVLEDPKLNIGNGDSVFSLAPDDAGGATATGTLRSNNFSLEDATLKNGIIDFQNTSGTSLFKIQHQNVDDTTKATGILDASSLTIEKASFVDPDLSIGSEESTFSLQPDANGIPTATGSLDARNLTLKGATLEYGNYKIKDNDGTPEVCVTDQNNTEDCTSIIAEAVAEEARSQRMDTRLLALEAQRDFDQTTLTNPTIEFGGWTLKNNDSNQMVVCPTNQSETECTFMSTITGMDTRLTQLQAQVNALQQSTGGSAGGSGS